MNTTVQAASQAPFAPRPVTLAIAFLITLVLAVWNSQGLMAQESPDHQELADRWIMAYNDHNPSALSALYTEDAHLMMHGAPTIKGRDAIGEFWAQDFTEDNPLTTLQVTHAMEGTDMILVHGNYQVINRNTGILLGQGRFAHLWTLNDDDEWLLDRDLWNEPFNAYPDE